MGQGRGGMAGGNMEEMQKRLAETRELMRRLAETQRRVLVEQTDSTVIFTWGTGARMELRPDGTKRKHDVRGFGEVEAKAKWEDGQLVLERSLDGGVTVTDEFLRAPGSERLLVTTRLSGSLPREFAFRSVYDREKAAG
jgi:hypothetical protein